MVVLTDDAYDTAGYDCSFAALGLGSQLSGSGLQTEVSDSHLWHVLLRVVALWL